MANINDFKIVNQKSRKYFDLLLNEIIPKKEIKKDKDKERFGFYLFILEYITGKKDVSDLIEIITDSDFNTRILGDDSDDLGVDAININEEEEIIQLFNFKYKENFGGKKSTINEAILSTKFINVLETKNTNGLNGKIKIKAEEIIEKLYSNAIWKLQLYIVSNEDFKIEKSNDLDRLEKSYELEIYNVGLKEINQFISLTPKPINAELILEKDAVMSFSEDSLV